MESNDNSQTTGSNMPPNQATQDVQHQTPPNVVQPTVIPDQASQSNLQQQQAENSTVVQATSISKPRKFFSKKVIFLFVMSIVVIVVIITLTTMKIGTGFIAQPKYLPSYLPSGLQKTEVKFEKNNNGENAYIVSYSAAEGGYLFFSQIINPIDRKCMKQPETNTKVTNYHDFLPIGSSEGCVHTTTPDGSNKIYYFRWMKDSVWFEFTTFKYELSDEEALKIADSIQIQENNSN